MINKTLILLFILCFSIVSSATILHQISIKSFNLYTDNCKSSIDDVNRYNKMMENQYNRIILRNKNDKDRIKADCRVLMEFGKKCKVKKSKANKKCKEEKYKGNVPGCSMAIPPVCR